MKRREIIQALLGVAIASGALKSGAATKLADLDALTTGAPLRDLPRLPNKSTDAGVFKGTLKAAEVSVPLLQGQAPTVFLAYNGMLPGPVIEVFEGDQVEITLVNELKQPTTVHWHGLQIPPEQDGSPHDAVPAGESRTYKFRIPKDSAGTYWYHPHPHHLTAEQAYRGLAGVFIVRSRADALADIPDRLLVASDLKLGADGVIPPSDEQDQMDGREGQFLMLNGQYQPQLKFADKGRERWRIVNACNARYLRLSLGESKFTLVGLDGGLLEKPVAGLSEYLLIPGARVEIVVDGSNRKDVVKLKALAYKRGKMMASGPDKDQTLCEVDFSKVAPDAKPAALPSSLRTIKDLGKPVALKRVVFSEKMSMAGGQHSMQFLVNGKSFDEKRIDLTSKVDEVEQWEITNKSDMDHPFHLHGVQFQVLEREMNGLRKAVSFRAWQDTVNLRSGETLRFKVVQHFKGMRMFHCHILEHEDAGMMGQLKVI